MSETVLLETITGIDGTLFFKCAKLHLGKSGEIEQEGGPNHFHRFSIPPGLDATFMIGVVNRSLVAMGCGELSAAAMKDIILWVTRIHTPEVVAAYAIATAEKQME